VPDVPPLRARELFERELLLPGDLRAPELDDLRAPDERLAPPVDDFARLAVDFFAPLERDAGLELFDELPLDRFAAGLRSKPWTTCVRCSTARSIRPTTMQSRRRSTTTSRRSTCPT